MSALEHDDDQSGSADADFSPLSLELPSVHQPPTNELIAEALRRHIRLGLYPPGDYLPTERELSEQFAVGRSTVRAAIRILTDEGLVRTHRGRSGGTMVRDDDRRTSRTKFHQLKQESIAKYIREIDDIYELRFAVEPMVAAQAARRATPEQRATLVTEAARRATTIAEYRAYDSRFHLALAQSGGNKYALETLQRLRTALFVWLDGLWSEVNEDARRHEEEHRAIALAVIASDEDKAKQLIERHLRRGQDAFRQALRDLADPGDAT